MKITNSPKKIKHPDLWTLRFPRPLRNEVVKFAKVTDSDASKYVRQAVREKMARDKVKYPELESVISIND